MTKFIFMLIIVSHINNFRKKKSKFYPFGIKQTFFYPKNLSFFLKKYKKIVKNWTTYIKKKQSTPQTLKIWFSYFLIMLKKYFFISLKLFYFKNWVENDKKKRAKKKKKKKDQSGIKIATN